MKNGQTDSYVNLLLSFDQERNIKQIVEQYFSKLHF